MPGTGVRRRSDTLPRALHRQVCAEGAVAENSAEGTRSAPEPGPRRPDPTGALGAPAPRQLGRGSSTRGTGSGGDGTAKAAR